MSYFNWISPSIGMQRLSLGDLLSGPSQSLLWHPKCACVCMCVRKHIYGYVCVCTCVLLCLVWCRRTYFCMDIHVCAPHFQKCHRLLSIWWALCSPSPHLSQGGSGARNSEWGGRLPAGPREESCLGWCVVTGSLAYESPAKLTQVSFGEKCNQLLHSVPF